MICERCEIYIKVGIRSGMSVGKCSFTTRQVNGNCACVCPADYLDHLKRQIAIRDEKLKVALDDLFVEGREGVHNRENYEYYLTNEAEHRIFSKLPHEVESST